METLEQEQATSKRIGLPGFVRATEQPGRIFFFTQNYKLINRLQWLSNLLVDPVVYFVGQIILLKCEMS